MTILAALAIFEVLSRAKKSKLGQPKHLTRSRENAKKPDFLKIAYKKNFEVFGGNRAVSPFNIYDGLTSCAKAKKSLDPNSRTFRY